MNSNKIKTSSLSTITKQALKINNRPLPWEKAISAGICSALPVFLSLIFGYFQYGLLAGIGSFTYLYVMNEPYAFRAKKLLFVLLGMTLSVGFGTLLAPNVIAVALMVGVIGAISTFIFGAFKIPGPAGIFFVLGFLMSSGMPVDPTLAPLRAGLVLSGGVLSWGVGMIGWFFKPYEIETIAVRKVYMALTSLIDSVGTEEFNEARQKLWDIIETSKVTLLAGYSSRQQSRQFNRLFLLNERANSIYVYILEHFTNHKQKLPSELGIAVQIIERSLSNNKQNNDVNIVDIDNIDEHTEHLVSKINDAIVLIKEPLPDSKLQINITKPKLTTVLGGSFDKNSIVFFTAIRYGFILIISMFIANSLDLNLSYWVTLSCAAVMSGSTIIATYHRAIQRSIGTIIGLLIATLILSMEPHGFVIAFSIMILTILTELSIVLNYGIAALFITPNALLLAESTSQIHNISFFAATRITDVVIGCIIGLIGTLLLGRKRASSLLPHFMAKTIRSQQQFLLSLFSKHRRNLKSEDLIERKKMQTNITNLKLVYTTALGEISNNKKALELLRPAITSIEHLAYLLESSLQSENRPVLTDESLSQLLFVFEAMAKTTEETWPISNKIVPKIQGFSKIQNEIIELQKSLKVLEKHPTISE